MYMPTLYVDRFFDDLMDGFTALPVPQRYGRPQKPERHCRPMRHDVLRSSIMKTDVREKDDSYELTIDLPGYSKENVRAELKDGFLTISAETDESNEEKDSDGVYVRRERYFGSVSRSFYVGDSVTEEDIRAKFTDGVLKLSVPKKQEEAPEKKYISIEG